MRRKSLRLEDLYLADGEYRGWNMRAIGATVLGCAFAWGGFIVPALKPLYDYAWLVGFFVAGGAHLALEARDAFFGRRHFGQQHLDRDATPDVQVMPFEHRTHPALTEQALDTVLAVDDLTNLQHSGR